MSTTVKIFLVTESDLSDKSNVDNDGKQVRESNVSVSLSKDDTAFFDEGIESPGCVGVLNNCLQNFKKNVNKIFEISSSTKEAQIKMLNTWRKLSNLLSSLMRNLKRWKMIERNKKKDKFRN